MAGELLILANPFASVTAKDFNATGRLWSRRRRQPGASLAEEDDNIAVGAGDEVFPMRFKSLSITGHVATEFLRSLSQSRPSPFLTDFKRFTTLQMASRRCSPSETNLVSCALLS